MPNSKWIRRVLYRRAKDGRTFLAIFTKRGDALLYADVPHWLPGVFARCKSVGAMYNKHVKGKFPYQRVTDDDKANELVTLMEGR